MKLWVRSQDKCFLEKANLVHFREMDKCEFSKEPSSIVEFRKSKIAYCVFCNGTIFGEYNSKERCLEILDEIQSWLCGISGAVVVYEMPKE